MGKPNQDPKPAGPVRRVARAVARHTNVRAAERTRQRILAEELDDRHDGGQRTELVRAVMPTPGPGCLARLGGRAAAGLGLAGILTATAAAAFVGVLDACLDVRPASTPAAADPPLSATCAEPASWCGGAPR